MTILPVVQGDTNPTLRTVCSPVTTFDTKLKKLIDDMKDTMLHGKQTGVGIAAPQVGVLLRAIIIDLGDEDKQDIWQPRPLPLINPVITAKSTLMQDSDEGCLSLPTCFGIVQRHHSVTVTYQDLRGAKHTLTLANFPACIVQHEIDHLDGILFTDRAIRLHPKKGRAKTE